MRKFRKAVSVKQDCLEQDYNEFLMGSTKRFIDTMDKAFNTLQLDFATWSVKGFREDKQGATIMLDSVLFRVLFTVKNVEGKVNDEKFRGYKG